MVTEIKGWMNIYHNGLMTSHPTREEADLREVKTNRMRRVACINVDGCGITFEAQEGILFPAKPHPSLLDKLKSMKQEERYEITSQFCHACGEYNGDKDLICQCWNDSDKAREYILDNGHSDIVGWNMHDVADMMESYYQHRLKEGLNE